MVLALTGTVVDCYLHPKQLFIFVILMDQATKAWLWAAKYAPIIYVT